MICDRCHKEYSKPTIGHDGLCLACAARESNERCPNCQGLKLAPLADCHCEESSTDPVQALKAMLSAFDCATYQDQFGIGSPEDKAIVQARAAIAEAEGRKS